MRLLAAVLFALLVAVLIMPVLAQFMPEHRADLSVWGLILAPVVWVALVVAVYWSESRSRPGLVLAGSIVLLAAGLVLI